MNTYSYKKVDRLLKRQEYLELKHTGKNIHTRHFLGVYAQGKTGRVRLGITVTKKVACATERNRIKRICREYFRLNRHKIKGAWDIHIIAKKKAEHASTSDAWKSLSYIFGKIS